MDVPALILSSSDHLSNEGVGFLLAVVAAAAGLMYTSYRAFRYGEQYQYRADGSGGTKDFSLDQFKDITGQIGDVMNTLGRFK